MWDLVGNPKDRFSHNGAHLMLRLHSTPFVLFHRSTCDTSNKYAMTKNWSYQNHNPSLKTKKEISKIANSQNTKRTYGRPSEQLFSKKWPLSNLK